MAFYSLFSARETVVKGREITFTMVWESCWSNDFPLTIISSILGKNIAQILLMYFYWPPRGCFEMIKYVARNLKLFSSKAVCLSYFATALSYSHSTYFYGWGRRKLKVWRIQFSRKLILVPTYPSMAQCNRPYYLLENLISGFDGILGLLSFTSVDVHVHLYIMWSMCVTSD